MRGRRSSRSAAVVLAGCVGLAVMAPGLALASPADEATTETACEALGAGFDWVGGTCVATSTSTTDDADTASDDSSSSAAATDTTGTTGSTGSAGATGSTVTVPETSTAPSSTTPGIDSPAGQAARLTDGAATTGTDATTTGTDATDDTTAPAPTPKALDAGGQEIINDLTGITLPGGVTLPDDFVPGAGSLADLLGGLEVPTTVPEGGFTNPREACAYLAAGLPIEGTPAQLQQLGTAFSQFCGALPTSFTGLDLDELIDQLGQLIRHCPQPDQYTVNITNNYVTNEWWGAYWHYRYDVDCPELTYDEANAILDADPSDPFRLDRDNDGEACEANAHGDDVDYVSYPEGGVATGDGSTSSGASPAEIALAGAALGGLGATGLVLVRRFARQG
jgi:hypothetical protein